MRYYLKKIRSSIFFIIISVSFFSCSHNPTKPKMGSISGKVLLNGQTDHSGILVEVYGLSFPKSELQSLMDRFPQIGVAKGQWWIFDHRYSQAISSTITNAGGDFSISGLTPGSYNVVARKDSSGWNYQYEVTVNGDADTHLSDITLYREIYIAADITSPTTWQSGRHYLIQSNVNVTNPLTIQPGVFVRFDGNYQMNVSSSFQATGTASQPICFIYNKVDNTNWQSLRISNLSSGVQMGYVKISNGYDGLKVDNCQGLTLQNIAIDSCTNNGLLFTQSSVTVQNSLIRSTYHGIEAVGVPASRFQDGIVFQSSFAGVFLSGADFHLNNSVISNSPNGAYIRKDSLYVTNCLIRNTNIAVDCGNANNSTSFAVLKDNIFENTSTYNIIASFGSIPTANGNNLDIGASWFILFHNPNGDTMNAQNNWWGTTNPVTISNKIDVSGGTVLTNPILSSANPLAGPQ